MEDINKRILDKIEECWYMADLIKAGFAERKNINAVDNERNNNYGRVD